MDRFFTATDEEGRVFIVKIISVHKDIFLKWTTNAQKRKLISQVKRKLFSFLEKETGEKRKLSAYCVVEPAVFKDGVAEIESR